VCVSGIRSFLARDEEAYIVFVRFQAHLDANEIDLTQEKVTLGPLLTMGPDREAFTDAHADEANRLLTKKYRKAFVIEGAETLG